jgi:hypothetical protein
VIDEITLPLIRTLTFRAILAGCPNGLESQRYLLGREHS